MRSCAQTPAPPAASAARTIAKQKRESRTRSPRNVSAQVDRRKHTKRASVFTRYDSIRDASHNTTGPYGTVPAVIPQGMHTLPDLLPHPAGAGPSRKGHTSSWRLCGLCVSLPVSLLSAVRPARDLPSVQRVLSTEQSRFPFAIPPAGPVYSVRFGHESMVQRGRCQGNRNAMDEHVHSARDQIMLDRFACAPVMVVVGSQGTGELARCAGRRREKGRDDGQGGRGVSAGR